MTVTSPAHPPLPRILILEDNDDDFSIYAETLLPHFQLERFTTLTQLLAVLEARTADASYDLLLIDLMLPDGYSVVRMRDFLQPRVGMVPFVVISARDEENFQRTTYELGGIDYIVKPFAVSELLVRLENAITRGRVRAAEQQFEPILPPIQLRIMKTVMGQPLQRMPKKELAAKLWKAPAESAWFSLKTHLTSMRKILPEHGFVLETDSACVAIKRRRSG